MATTTDSEVLRRKERVVAAVNMPGIPAGTAGKVVMVSGYEWIRYWVRFENGVVRGSISRDRLARPGEPVGAEREAPRAAAAVPAEATGEVGGETPAAAGDEGVVHAGVLIPAHLLERSKQRREALGIG